MAGWGLPHVDSVRRDSVTAPPYGREMPRVSAFYGISILMYFRDHNPPHFHARYSGHEAKFALDGTLISGRFPRRASRLVRDWSRIHRVELEACWERSVSGEPPGIIRPLR